MNMICRIFGHRLMTSVNARVPTLYCSRCKLIHWVLYHGLIIKADATQADLDKLGLSQETPGSKP